MKKSHLPTEKPSKKVREIQPFRDSIGVIAGGAGWLAPFSFYYNGDILSGALSTALYIFILLWAWEGRGVWESWGDW